MTLAGRTEEWKPLPPEVAEWMGMPDQVAEEAVAAE